VRLGVDNLLRCHDLPPNDSTLLFREDKLSGRLLHLRLVAGISLWPKLQSNRRRNRIAPLITIKQENMVQKPNNQKQDLLGED